MATTVRGLAFRFQSPAIAKEASFENYFSWLANRNNIKHRWPYYRDHDKSDSGYHRSMFVYDSKLHYYGLVFSTRTDKTEHHIETAKDGGIILKQEAVDKARAEVNFFCLRKDSFKGLYSHYMGSYPMSSFIQELWVQYSHFTAREWEKKRGLFPTEKAAKKEKHRFSLRGKRQCGPYWNPAGFDHLLTCFEDISEMTFCTYDKINNAGVVPANMGIRSVTQTMRFEKKTKLDQRLTQYVKQCRELSKRTSKNDNVSYNGSVSGIKDNGEEAFIGFEKTMDDYLKLNYDQLGEIALNSLEEHHVIESFKKNLKHISFSEDKR
jgi:hypothetical protein